MMNAQVFLRIGRADAAEVLEALRRRVVEVRQIAMTTQNERLAARCAEIEAALVTVERSIERALK